MEKQNIRKKIQWDLSGSQVEEESFKRIEDEMHQHSFSPQEWRIARRLIHSAGDFSIVENLRFSNNPIESGIIALTSGVPIFCDVNMIRHGLSLAKLGKFNQKYSRENIHCYISDVDVIKRASESGLTRALCSVEKARPLLNGAVVLVGNAPLALARIVQYAIEDNIRPALVIGVPVGFVNVIESKEYLAESGLPHISIAGRKGGSTMAVAILHAIYECFTDFS